jgi:predicted nucleic acid-binding Zn ribbon protein
MPEYIYECASHGRVTVAKSADDAGRPEYCTACVLAGLLTGPHMRRIFTPQGFIMRPSGYRRSPDDPKFSDFRREMELGELRDDPTPVRMTPEEIDRFDNPPLEIPPDPERDRALHQLVAQHWTEDLSDDTVRRRELTAAAHQRGEMAEAS